MQKSGCGRCAPSPLTFPNISSTLKLSSSKPQVILRINLFTCGQLNKQYILQMHFLQKLKQGHLFGTF